MSGIVSCSRCERIKDEAEDCDFLGCNPRLTWSETGPYELYGLLHEMRTERDAALALAERRAGEIAAFVAAVGHTVIVDGPVEAAWNALVAAVPPPGGEDAGGVMATEETRPAYDDRAAEAWADRVAMFILHKIASADGALTLSEIAPNLAAPHGWISFAKLWRADYIDVMGEFVTPTEAGVAAIRELAAPRPKRNGKRVRGVRL